MSKSLYEQKDYEKGHRGAFRKNKPNQSQLPTTISPKTCAWGDFPLGSGE